MKSKLTTNEKQNMKRQRIKMFFLKAAKGVILREGAENVSVRKVADLAGYSYATIYNYFADHNEMLWEVKKLMTNDIVEYMQKKMQQDSYDREGIKRLFRAYIAYFYKNPNVFRFFYMYPLSSPMEKTSEAEDQSVYDQMWNAVFKSFVLAGVIREKDIEVLSKIFIYTIHGLMVLGFADREDQEEENIYKDMDQMIDYLLHK